MNGHHEEFGAQIRFQDSGSVVSLLRSDIDEELERWFRPEEVASAAAESAVASGSAAASGVNGSVSASDSAAFDKAWQRLQETADEEDESVRDLVAVVLKRAEEV